MLFERGESKTKKYISGGGLVTKSCPTLCGPMDRSLWSSFVNGVLQARILEWVAISSPGDLAHRPRDWPTSPALQMDSFTTEPPGKAPCFIDSVTWKTQATWKKQFWFEEKKKKKKNLWKITIQLEKLHFFFLFNFRMHLCCKIL